MKPHEIREVHLDKMDTLFTISDVGHRYYMPCPLYSHPETSRSCGETCPWFNIRQGQYWGYEGPFVCCQEHVIGKLIVKGK